MEYQLIDSGDGRKLERFGKLLLIRPCPQAVWSPTLPKEKWDEADAYFERDQGNRWVEKKALAKEWTVLLKGVVLKLKRTEFGHLGVFPEHASQWEWIEKQLIKKPHAKVLNLFAYSGATTLALAKAGAQVCHVDAAKGMVDWARENAALNHLESAPIRWIVDDARKFLAREVRRGVQYDGIILDPPSFGRGKSGEVFKIEEDLPLMLEHCKKLLANSPLFILFSCHTPGYTPLVMQQVLRQYFKDFSIEAGEMVLDRASHSPFVVPSGTYVRGYV